MPTSVAKVTTELPKRYMVQLCKHFEHRLAVTQEGDTGRIAFDYGSCDLAVEPGTLVMKVEAADADTLARVEDVVARHLLRFAFREPPEIVWVQVAHFTRATRSALVVPAWPNGTPAITTRSLSAGLNPSCELRCGRRGRRRRSCCGIPGRPPRGCPR